MILIAGCLLSAAAGGQTTTPTAVPTFTPTILPTPLPFDLATTGTVSPEPVAAGAFLTYQIQVHNFGPGSPQSPTLFDPLPAALQFVSCTITSPSPGATCTSFGNFVDGEFLGLPPGTTGTVTVVAQVLSAAGTIFNTVDAAYVGADSNTGNNFLTLTSTIQGGQTPTRTPTPIRSRTPTVTLTDRTPTNTPTPSLTPTGTLTDTPTLTPTSDHTADVGIFGMATPEPVASGQVLVYDFFIESYGPGDTLDSFVTVHLPPEVVFVSCDTHGVPGTSCRAAPGTVDGRLGPLTGGPNRILTVTVLVVAPSGGSIQTAGSVTYSGIDPNPVNDVFVVFSTIQGGVPPTATSTSTPVPPSTATPTPNGGIGAAGTSIPTLAPVGRFALLLALFAAGWFVISRRAS